MKIRTLLSATLLALLASASQAGIAFGSNLVVNGDAEAGTTGWSGYDVYSPIQAVDYGDNWVKPSEPGPTDRGSMMFTGTGSYAVAYQTLALGQVSTQDLAFSLSGWLGGWLAQGDNAVFAVSFLGSDDAEIGSAMLGPVLPDERGYQSGLWLRQAEGWMPSGTSKIGFWLSMERHGGGDNDGYADNLSFVLAAPNEVPEPQSLALLALGLAMMGSLRHGRSRQR